MSSSAKYWLVATISLVAGCNVILGLPGFEFEEGVGGAGGAGAAGGQGGSVCSSPSDCPGQDETCQQRSCEAGSCGFSHAAEGTPCTEAGGQVCDGLGSCVACVVPGDCGNDETCVDNQCVPIDCTDQVQNGDESDVDCGGSCPGCVNGLQCGQASDCQSLFCDPGDSRCAPCSDTTDCADAPGTYCDGGSCVATKGDGESCQTDEECASDHCPGEDGVCCDDPCDQTCEACLATKTGGVDGSCAPVTGASDPDDECAMETPSSCGATGAGCSGTAARCTLYAAATPCAAQSCSGGVTTGESTCNGLGSCLPGAQTSCDPYLCNLGGSACLSSCTTHGDCIATHHCHLGACEPKLGNGSDCLDADGCVSGLCVDDVCCDSLCGGACESCALGGSLGTCTAVAAGQDPDGECNLGDACDGNGACKKADGVSCAAGSECISGQCTDDVCCNSACGSTCQGCVITLTGQPNGQCAFVTANTDPEAECPGLQVCNGAGACGLKTNGASCAAGNECESTICKDQVCCSTSCNGLCVACNLAGSLGTCDLIPAGQDPSNECVGPSTCDGNGGCN